MLSPCSGCSPASSGTGEAPRRTTSSGCREDVAADLHALSSVVSYGWGVIPVKVRIGESDWRTSLFPKDGSYLVPIKDAIRNREGIALGETVLVEMAIRS
jgi:uncharacterized protein DUF1905